MKYFFDTYALIEIAKNNPNYINYSDSTVVTTIFNLAELYYVVLRDFNDERAESIYYKFKECINEVDDDVIFGAMRLKLKNKKMSYTDCIGYSYALKHDLKFLTGDRAFEQMESVELVR